MSGIRPERTQFLSQYSAPLAIGEAGFEVPHLEKPAALALALSSELIMIAPRRLPYEEAPDYLLTNERGVAAFVRGTEVGKQVNKQSLRVIAGTALGQGGQVGEVLMPFGMLYLMNGQAQRLGGMASPELGLAGRLRDEHAVLTSAASGLRIFDLSGDEFTKLYLHPDDARRVQEGVSDQHEPISEGLRDQILAALLLHTDAEDGSVYIGGSNVRVNGERVYDASTGAVRLKLIVEDAFEFPALEPEDGYQARCIEIDVSKPGMTIADTEPLEMDDIRDQKALKSARQATADEAYALLALVVCES